MNNGQYQSRQEMLKAADKALILFTWLGGVVSAAIGVIVLPPLMGQYQASPIVAAATPFLLPVIAIGLLPFIISSLRFAMGQDKFWSLLPQFRANPQN